MLICTAASLLLGLGAAAVYRLTTRQPSRNMFVTMLVLSVLIQAVIMLVNGNIGAGLAVAGTFALVRFRSVPGSAKEITGLFFSVALGLACGMGYVAIAGLFFVIISLFLLLLERFRFGQNSPAERQLNPGEP